MQEEVNELKEMIDSDIESIGGIENFNNYCAAHEVITSWIDRILKIIEKNGGLIMTEEQEEAIKSLTKLVNLRKRKNKIKHDNCICSTRDLDIVLDMLKEKDKEIEILKEEKNNRLSEKNADLAKNYTEIATLEREILKKDKIIDEIAEYIFQNIDIEEDICNSAYIKCKQEMAQDITCINCIKQYFENKVRKEK